MSAVAMSNSKAATIADGVPYCISIDNVQDAAQRISGTAHRTPVLMSHTLNQVAGGRQLYFKVEALQRTGSFKFRGALNAIRSIMENNGDPHGSNLQVVTHSSGNHAQALALAAKLASTDETTVTATIVMPDNTPTIKRNAVADYGGQIVLVASTNEARESEASRIVAETGAQFVHPSEDPRVIAGQGTVCLEMVQQVQEELQGQLDVVIIPVGGGGLASGNSVALRALLGASVKIVLAEPAELDDAKRSFEAGELLPHASDNQLRSCADGLKTTLGPNTWPIVRDHVNAIITVSERDILSATKLIWERLKICIEPSAGVGVAVLLSTVFAEKFPVGQYKNVGIVLCGGNVDVLKITAAMQLMGL